MHGKAQVGRRELQKSPKESQSTSQSRFDCEFRLWAESKIKRREGRGEVTSLCSELRGADPPESQGGLSCDSRVSESAGKQGHCLIVGTIRFFLLFL